jgi:hypothetical protein
VRQFARHKFSLERQRQAVAGYARPKWVMKAIAHAIEMAAEGACLRSWEGESISRAGIPISLATEPFSLLLREPRLPQQYQCQRLVVGYIKRLAGRVVQEGQKFVFPIGHGSGRFRSSSRATEHGGLHGQSPSVVHRICHLIHCSCFHPAHLAPGFCPKQ